MKKVQHPPALSALFDEEGFYGIDYVFNVIQHKICISIYYILYILDILGTFFSIH